MALTEEQISILIRLVAALAAGGLIGLERSYRGRPAADLDSLADAVVRLGWLAADLADVLSEIDVNPLIVGPHGACAVDALVVPAGKTTGA